MNMLKNLIMSIYIRIKEFEPFKKYAELVINEIFNDLMDT